MFTPSKILSVVLAISLMTTSVSAAEMNPSQTDVEVSDSIAITEHYIPLYFQTDYPDTRYGHGTVASSGCGVTSLAMVATYLTGHAYYPDELAGYFGGRAENNIQRLECGSDTLQLPWHKAKDFWDVMAALNDGNIVIALMSSDSIFTSSQHFIVLTGLNEDGKIMVNDPYEPNYQKWILKRAFQEGFSEGDILCGFSGGWIYDVNAMPEDPFIYTESKEVIPTRYPDINLTWEEQTLLAKVIWVESRGECPEGQQAVAEVVLNRMVSDNFPDTLSEVIFAEGQFNSAKFLDDADPGQAQYEALENALNGVSVLPIDVVYFARTPKTDKVWGQIGGHVFCYPEDYGNETVTP